MTLSTLTQSIFSWFSGKETSTPTKTTAARPYPRDLTGGYVANAEMLTGLYHGTFQGLQFASPLAYTPIARPVAMMGLPTPTSNDERTQEVLTGIVAAMGLRITKLHRSQLLLGTTWRWPRYDAKSDTLVWEEIPDSAVADILIDVLTGQPSAILTDEEFNLSISENLTTYARRKRRFDTSRIVVTWSGQKPGNVDDYTARNVAGILPIAFAHDADEGDIRGYSSLARIIRDLKDYHDTDFRVSEMLTKFLPKMVQDVEDVGRWCENNLGSSDTATLATYDMPRADMVINRFDHDKTDYKFLPDGATAPHEKALERKYWKIFEGSGIPELFWGPLATGNHATTIEQLQQAVDYVTDCRAEVTPAYQALFAASLRLLSIAHGETYSPFDVKWNVLSALSADMKSQIFQRFAASIAQLSQSAMITKRQVYDLWAMNYPDIPVGEFEDWQDGIKDMASFQQFAKMDYFSGLEDAGYDQGDGATAGGK